LLAQELWESVAEKASEIPVSANQAAVLEQRLQTLVSDENPGESWEIVKRRILGEQACII